jgi:exosortase/archaeosortase
LIGALPGQSSAQRDSGIIAIRLIALLPEKAGFSPASREVSPNASALNNSRAIMYVIILNVMFMAIAFGSQYFAANRQPAAHIGQAHASVTDKAPPKVPSANFGK